MVRTGRIPASVILFCTTVFLSSLADAKIARLKRQTVVSSNANSNGTADDVESSAAAHHWKTEDGVIGVNVSSAGNATGAGHANLTNNAFGSAGDKSITANGDVSALGQNSKSTSDIDANIIGNNQTVTNYQQGLASGTGDTQAQANSNTIMGNGDQHGVYNGNNSQASAGATGSIGSNSEVVLSQTLTWDSILAQLVGSATAQGVYNAQANMDLGAGTQENGVEVNGLVSGDNSGGGLVNANVNGNGNMDNGNHELSGNLSGNVNGTGDTNLVGASNLQSNNSGKITGIASFGDTKINSDGQTGASMNGQSNLASANGVTGNIHSDGTANGGTKNMTVNNGLKVDENGENTLAMGNGGLQGSGTQATNGTLSVDTKYNGNGDAAVVVNGDGQSAASGYNASALDISANADLAGSHGLANNGLANAAGVVNGEHSNMTGNAFLNLDGSGSSGNANMDAQGGGKGPSSALTSGALELTDGDNVKRNASVQGSVQADGDETSVRSISIVTDYGGKQSLSNYQNATSNSAGSSSAHASNAGVLKRKRRHAALGWLTLHVAPPLSAERIII